MFWEKINVCQCQEMNKRSVSLLCYTWLLPKKIFVVHFAPAANLEDDLEPQLWRKQLAAADWDIYLLFTCSSLGFE